MQQCTSSIILYTYTRLYRNRDAFSLFFSFGILYLYYCRTLHSHGRAHVTSHLGPEGFVETYTYMFTGGKRKSIVKREKGRAKGAVLAVAILSFRARTRCVGHCDRFIIGKKVVESIITCSCILIYMECVVEVFMRPTVNTDKDVIRVFFST